jgi:hypothetical protein
MGDSGPEKQPWMRPAQATIARQDFIVVSPEFPDIADPEASLPSRSRQYEQLRSRSCQPYLMQTNRITLRFATPAYVVARIEA